MSRNERERESPQMVKRPADQDRLVSSVGLGILPEVLSLCDGCVHFPMLGMGNSINLSNSVAIALYEATRV